MSSHTENENSAAAAKPEAEKRSDFIRDIIDDDLRAGRHQRVATRFPPEPNGYLHIGHAKSICLNFGLARDYGGSCNLRFDDTNPTKEDVEYVESIERDVRWLGFEPSAVLFSADYFPRMYELAEGLVAAGLAYVCDLDDEQIRQYRGTLTEAGTPSPFRDRSVGENLDLLRRMKAGEFADGARVLRAKIDMAAANMKMRDPLLYRIRHAHHHRTGDAWRIYPMYDYAHPLEDAIEGITHSICTLEFENNRELYDWVIEKTGVSQGRARPHQYEFARLALDYTIMSKRKLLTLVEGGHVDGWDDPRMPTIAGMRRRGYSAAALRAFCDMIGVAKANSTVDIDKLEYCVRDELNQTAPRVLGVLRPLEVELIGATPATFDAPLFPPDIGKPGSRALPFGTTIYIDQDDWRDDPPAGYQRLAPGRTVRLRYGPCITCDQVERDAVGAVVKLRATVVEGTAAGRNPSDGRKVSGVLHWVDAKTSIPAEVRLYGRLFNTPKPEEGGADFLTALDPTSRQVIKGARVEASLAHSQVGSRWQLERNGYFVIDSDSRPDVLVLNRVVSLKEAREAKVEGPKSGACKDEKDHAKAVTRPKGKSPAEYRAEARERNPELKAGYEAALARGLPAEQADLVCGDVATTALWNGIGQTVPPELAAKWIINELPRALSGTDLSLELSEVLAPRLTLLLTALADSSVSAAAGTPMLAAIVSGKSFAEARSILGSPLGAEELAAAVERIAASVFTPTKVKAEIIETERVRC